MATINARIDLDLEDVDDSLKSDAKEEIREFIIDSTLEEIARGRSPIQGEPRWQKLNKEYAKEQKGGDRTPNMELTGDMLDDYERGWRPGVGDFLEFQINGFSGDKADGHCHLVGNSSLPRRRFIPGEGQVFNDKIMSGIKKIEREYKDLTESRREESVPDDIEEISPSISRQFTLGDVFGSQGQSIIDRIAQRLRDG